MLVLETERLFLRDFRCEDRQAYVELRNDDKFKRFYCNGDVTEAKSVALVEMFIAQSKKTCRSMYQLAISTKNGDLIGSCGIRIDCEQQASVGCELGRKWQHAGYANEAARELINFGFTACNLHRVYAETIMENKAAVKLCQLLGMRLEAELIENRYFNGRWWSTNIFGLLNREWVYEITQDI